MSRINKGEKFLKKQIAFSPDYEKSSYWQEWFESLLTDPRGLLVWQNIFDEVEVTSFKVAPDENPDQAKARHQRKLRAMLEALEEIQSPALNQMLNSIRQQLAQ